MLRAHVVHVWHMFYPQLTEARQAWDELGRFLEEAEAVDLVVPAGDAV